MSKTLKVKPSQGNTSLTKEVKAPTVEHALRDLAKQVKSGEVEVPFVLEFEGPSGLQFSVAVDTVEQAGEMQTMGFMF